MIRWTERGDDEFTRVLRDGRLAKVLGRHLLIRVAVGGEMVDDVYFSAREAMEAIDRWDSGVEPLTLHPIDKLWVDEGPSRYSRRSDMLVGLIEGPGAVVEFIDRHLCSES